MTDNELRIRNALFLLMAGALVATAIVATVLLAPPAGPELKYYSLSPERYYCARRLMPENLCTEYHLKVDVLEELIGKEE